MFVIVISQKISGSESCMFVIVISQKISGSESCMFVGVISQKISGSEIITNRMRSHVCVMPPLLKSETQKYGNHSMPHHFTT